MGLFDSYFHCVAVLSCNRLQILGLSAGWNQLDSAQSIILGTRKLVGHNVLTVADGSTAFAVGLL